MELLLETIVDPAALGAARSEWDALVERLSKPYCLPAWLLAWWTHVAPKGSLLKIFLLRDTDGGLVGVAPFYAYRRRGLWHYSLLASSLSPRVEPIVDPAHLDAAGTKIAQALAAADPKPDVIELEGVPAESRWTDRIRQGWPTRKPYLYARPGEGAPTVALTEVSDLDAWFGTRTKNFRHQMRRFRRRAEEAGGAFRATATEDELKHDLAEFERLHRGRWEWRGGTDAFPPGTDRMLEQAGRELLSSGRFRVSSLEIDGKAITGQLYLAAGDEISVWATGFDDDYADLRPSYLTLVDGIDTALKGGYKRFDLGAGTQPYKKRFADGEDGLEWVCLVPPGPRYALARALIAPEQTRYAITTRLTPEQKESLKSLPERARQRLRRAPSPS